MVLGGSSETFPWTLSRKTFETEELKFLHGSCPFFGGRSTFWSAWSPQPTPDLMRDFPESMIKTAEEDSFWEEAKKLMNVTTAKQIQDGIFGSLQTAIDNILAHSIMVDCTVKNMIKGDDDDYVRVVETSKGALSWTGNRTRIILCTGAIANATILLNSFESCRDTVGKRLTGHYDTHISARCPVKNIKGWKKEKTLQVAAAYVAGKDPKTGLQYHVSVTAVNSPHPEDDAEDLARECPDYAAAATYDQLVGSENHVVFVCSALGEFNEKNKKNHVTLNKGTDPTCNVTLQYTLSDEDRIAWDVMDQGTYDTIKEMAGGDVHESDIEWWNEASHKWCKNKPPVETIRIPGVVHESSTCFMGPKEIGGSVDELYRPHGIENVHVTGSALFPTAGSWNPTMTMCGYAQDLARRLHEMKVSDGKQ
ncbi:hypothetical protein NW752_010967 [Fusarium irregulare]|nr:hypothetical protein NW752_010967 [Fusarium irregulare]